MMGTSSSNVMGYYTLLLTLSASSACLLKEHIISLEENPQILTSTISFAPFQHTLVLKCLGVNFSLKKWTTDDSIHGFTVEELSPDQLSLQLPCESVKTCNKISLVCSGTPVNGSGHIEVDVVLLPQCDELTNKTSLLNSSEVTERTEKPWNISDMKYLGVIIGFSVCFILALISALIVCIQKKCHIRQWSRLCGCTGYEATRSQDDYHTSQNRKVGPIPMLGFVSRSSHSAQQSQKSSAMHEL